MLACQQELAELYASPAWGGLPPLVTRFGLGLDGGVVHAAVQLRIAALRAFVGGALGKRRVARLALHPWFTNIQASWVKLGPEGIRQALAAGVNDLGGTLMNESISRAAGSEFGQEMPPEAMEALIQSAGRVPRQRTTLYGHASAERRATSFGAAPLSEPVNPPAKEAGLKAPPRLVRPGFAAAR